MGWISFVLWAVFVQPVLDGAVDVGVVVHDPATEQMAALRLSDRARVSAKDVHSEGRVLWIRLGTAPPQPSEPSATTDTAYGWATGGTSAIAMLRGLAARWSGARHFVAALASSRGAAVFEGHACDGCVAVQRGQVAIAGVGLDPPDVSAFASHVGAVEGDVIDRLLRFARDVDELWPHRPGPASALLVVTGPGRAREEIAVDKHGHVGRRLVERHLRHLAEVEVPFQLAQAKAAFARGDDEALLIHRRRALAAARRAIEAFPSDRTLRRRLRVAEALLPEHVGPTP